MVVAGDYVLPALYVPTYVDYLITYFGYLETYSGMA